MPKETMVTAPKLLRNKPIYLPDVLLLGRVGTTQYVFWGDIKLFGMTTKMIHLRGVLLFGWVDIT